MTTVSPRRVIVVGAGGIGSWLAEGLAATLSFKAPGSMLLVVDGDTYEPKNLERQSFDALGNKASVTAARLQRKFDSISIIGLPAWVVADDKTDDVDDEDEENGVRKVTASALIEDGDTVFAVVDNYAARKLLFDAAAGVDNVDVFTGGNDDQLWGSTYHYRRRDGIDVTEHPAEYHPELANPPDRNPGELSCQERAEIEGGTQLIAINMTVAGVLLGMFHQNIVIDASMDAEPGTSPNELMFDIGAGRMLPYDRRPQNTPATV